MKPTTEEDSLKASDEEANLSQDVQDVTTDGKAGVVDETQQKKDGFSAPPPGIDEDTTGSPNVSSSSLGASMVSEEMQAKELLSVMPPHRVRNTLRAERNEAMQDGQNVRRSSKLRRHRMSRPTENQETEGTQPGAVHIPGFNSRGEESLSEESSSFEENEDDVSEPDLERQQAVNQDGFVMASAYPVPELVEGVTTAEEVGKGSSRGLHGSDDEQGEQYSKNRKWRRIGLVVLSIALAVALVVSLVVRDATGSSRAVDSPTSDIPEEPPEEAQSPSSAVFTGTPTAAPTTPKSSSPVAVPTTPDIPVMLHQAKLVAPDGGWDDVFGGSVAIQGNLSIVGAPEDDDNGLQNSGTVYLFERLDQEWAFQSKLYAWDAQPEDYFGDAVALDSVSLPSDTLVVGATGVNINNVSQSGAVYVFSRNGTTWQKHSKLVTHDFSENQRFGWSVAMDSDTIFAGAPGDYDYTGAAYVFVRTNGTWSQQAKLVADDGQVDDEFGITVDIYDDTIVAGAMAHDNGNVENGGAAYVFVRNGTTWSQQAKLRAFDEFTNDYFGVAVAVYGDTIAVGADYSDPKEAESGSVYVFVRNTSEWIQTSKLFPGDGDVDDNFGKRVDLLADKLLVSARDDDDDAGSAYLYSRGPGDTWILQKKFLAGDRSPGDNFASSLYLDSSAHQAVIGCRFGDGRNGSAYVFDFS